MRNRDRGFSLALVLVAMLLLALVLGAMLLRLQAGRQVATREADRVQARYRALGAMNLVLEAIRRGASPAQAARQVAARTGQEILVAGDRILVSSAVGPIQGRLLPRAWNHVLFASALDLRGLRGAFADDDPHAPDLGTLPVPAASYLESCRDRARASGIYLAADPSACEFRPGGGSWRREEVAGQPSFLYLGGGAGADLGWVPGVHRWTLADARWTSSTGPEFRLEGGGWVLGPEIAETLEGLETEPANPGPVLPGTLFADRVNLSVRTPVVLHGQVVVQGGALEVRGATCRVEASPDTVAVLVTLGGDAPAALADWALDPRPRPGDLLLHTGSGRLAAGDPARPEETGALVLAQGRLVKRGTGLRVAGVVAAGRADVDGVAAEDLVWSGRVGRQPPDVLPCPDLTLRGLGAPTPR